MHVQTMNLNVMGFYHSQHMAKLVYTDAKFGIDVTHRYVAVAPSHDVRIQTQAAGN
jgi:hypothetical protein